MKVKFFAYLRDYTNTKSLDIENYETLEELLYELCNTFGEKLKKAIFDGENLSNEIIIMVNGRHIVHLDGLKTKLMDNDEISIFPVVAGG
ncbi:ubiquitin-like small modifier protein 1 [Candidatus Clostridium radicumherbarum]|uniref:Ubiquitin-like small modifier protein 1 n=1 Tax=Candidatus Clostridium radicumherbarum TaxID=3381662 RepID=A0ABW8TTL1_9CLOT